MEKIQKFLRKVTHKEYLQACRIIERIEQGNLENLNIKKLKGKSNEFRVRHGKLRIKYKVENSIAKILSIGYRSEKTYKNT